MFCFKGKKASKIDTLNNIVTILRHLIKCAKADVKRLENQNESLHAENAKLINEVASLQVMVDESNGELGESICAFDKFTSHGLVHPKLKRAFNGESNVG